MADIFKRRQDDVTEYTDQPGAGGTRVQTSPAPSTTSAAQAAKTMPSIRSATFKGADGGARPQASRDAAYKARENVLLRGLPERTSAYERRLALRNARRGGELKHNSKGWYTDYSRNDAEVEALRAQYAGEDDRYAQGYQALTGRQDAGQLAERQMQNKLAQTGARNQGQLERQSMVGADAYDREKLAQDYQSQRHAREMDLDEARFVSQYGEGGTERQAAAAAAEDRERRLGAEDRAIFNQQMGAQLAPLIGNDEDLALATMSEMPDAVRNEPDQAKQLKMAQRFALKKAAELSGAVRRSNPYLAALDKKLGVGGLAGAEKVRTGGWMDEIFKQGSQFLPGINYGVGKGDVVYGRGEGKNLETLIVDPEYLTEAQRRYGR